MTMDQTRDSHGGTPAFRVLCGPDFGWTLRRFLRQLPQDYIGTMSQIRSAHGPLVQWRLFGGRVNFAFVFDPAVNRALFVRHGADLRKSPSQAQTFLYAAGPSVATAHGPDWRVKRKEANSLFSRQMVEASCAGQVSVVRDYIRSLKDGAHDATVMARRLAALTSSRGILGRAISLAEADRQIAFSTAAAERFNAESAHVFARPHWMLAPWRRTLRARRAEAFAIVEAAIASCRQSSGGQDGLLAHYVNGDFVTSDDAQMQSILVGLLMGAQDNIAAGLGWVLAYVGHDPRLQDALSCEIAGRGAQADDLQACRLLQATVAEVLRLCPPAPANQPRVLQRSITLAGHVLPKGTFVFNSFYAMHRDPSVFPDPDRFDPRRFLDGRLQRSPAFAPFGHGPRNCVAQGMAMQQLTATLFALLQDRRIGLEAATLPAPRQQPFLTPAPYKVLLGARPGPA